MLIERYGIKPGQIYHRSDGTDPQDHHLIVVDTTSHAECDDVVVRDVYGGHERQDTRRIDAFKLALVRYHLAS